MKSSKNIMLASASAAAVAAASNQSFRGFAKGGDLRADTGNMPAEVKAAIDKFQGTWDAYQKANDERLAGIDAKFNDVIKQEEVDRINASLDEMTTNINNLIQKHASLELNGDGGVNGSLEDRQLFAQVNGLEEPVSIEDMKAYNDAMNVYLRVGDKKMGSGLQAAMEVGADDKGGYTVTPDQSGRIVKKLFETSPMREEAFVTTIGTDALEGFNDLDEAAQGWVGEKQSRPETDTPDLGKWSIPVHEQYAAPKVTQKLLDDSMFDIAAWLSEKVADKFARTENTAFVVGDGMLKPRGFLTYDTASTADAARAWGTLQYIASGSTSGFSSSDKLVDIVFALKNGYRNNAKWFMNRQSLGVVRKLKDGDGNYLWQPNFSERLGSTLLVYGIRELEDMPDIAANTLSVAFGDMREAYTIVDRQGIRVLRDPFTAKPFVIFYTTKRVGGGLLNSEALKVMKFAAS